MAGKRRDSAIGIDIGLDSVRVAELHLNRGLRIGRMASQPLRMGAIGRDSEVNWVVLENTLRQALKDFKVKGKRVHVSVPAALTVVRQLNLPDFSDEELREVIAFELTNSIHLPFEEVVFDFVRCPKGDDGDATGTASVILIAADRRFMDELVSILRKFSIRPTSIDVRPLATLRVLKRVNDLPETFLLVESDSRGAKVHVFHDGRLYLTRQVPIELLDEQGLSPAARGFADEDGGEPKLAATELASSENTDVTIERLAGAQYVTRFGAEIDRTMNFFRYTLHQRSADFTELIYAGHADLPPYVRTALAERIGIPVWLFSFQDALDSGQFGYGAQSALEGHDDALNDYTAAVGLAMREV